MRSFLAPLLSGMEEVERGGVKGGKGEGVEA